MEVTEKKHVVVATANVQALIAGALPKGACVQYWRGLLAADKGEQSKFSESTVNELAYVAGAVWRLYEAGAVQLTQMKHKDHDYSYLATVTGKEVVSVAKKKGKGGKKC